MKIVSPRIIQFVVVSLGSLVLVALLYPFWLKEDTTSVSFTVQHENTDVVINVSSTSSESRPFKPMLLSQDKQPSVSKINFSTESLRTKKIEINIASQANTFKFSDFQLIGLWTLGVDDFKFGSLTNIDDFKIENKEIILTKNAESASFECSLSSRLIKRHEVSFSIFLSLFILSFLILNKTAQVFLSIKRENEETRLSSLLFILLFFVVAVIPALKINKNPNAVAENRRLAQYKPLFDENYKINNQFGADFDTWFSDRFFLRDKLIEGYDAIHWALTNSLENSNVLPGKDNWLFYKDGGAIANFSNLELFSEEELINAKNYLNAINEWAKKHNKKFIYIIAPDKNKIYGEFYPNKYKKKYDDSQSRANQLVRYLKEYTDVKVLYFYDVLHANKDEGLLYFKNDTHWNSHGAYIAYQELMNIYFPNDDKLIAKGVTEYQKLRGDITGMGNNIPEETSVYLRPSIDFTHKTLSPSNQEQSGSEAVQTKNTKPLAKKNIFILQDSFGSEFLPYLASTFQEGLFVWRYSLTASDLENIKENYDVIILEQVERNISLLPSFIFPEVR